LFFDEKKSCYITNDHILRTTCMVDNFDYKLLNVQNYDLLRANYLEYGELLDKISLKCWINNNNV
jgi:hypothetical protein